jgi:hypothetical protein
MSFISILLTVLGILLLLGLGTMVALFFVGRRLYLSWRKPYKRAIDSLQRLSHTSLPFLQEFTHHPLFRQWLRAEGKRDMQALTVLFCATDNSTKGYILSSLPKYEQKKLHTRIKQKRNFTKEDVERTVATVRSYMDNEYHHPAKKLDLSFYSLYFYEDYRDALSYIQNCKKLVNPTLQDTIDDIVVSVLHSIPYYRSRRMYEQQHKFETFLTKDLPDMIELISQLPPSQRQEKEKELGLFLKEFQLEFEEAENSMYSSVENALNVKMRAAKEKFHKN